MKSSISGIAGTTLLIFSLFGCASSPNQQSTGEYIDDVAITAKVKSALVEAPETQARDIQVESFKGTVQLSGFVDSAGEKERAGALARQVTGVERVENKISVK